VSDAITPSSSATITGIAKKTTRFHAPRIRLPTIAVTMATTTLCDSRPDLAMFEAMTPTVAEISA
jgi:hypothetical protein